MRGQVLTIEGKKIFTFGGAKSHDISGGILELNDPDFYDKRKELESWFFGHYHDNMEVSDKEILIYEQIIRIA